MAKFEGHDELRERFAAGTPEHKAARVEIRCSAKTKALASRMAKRARVSVSELFRDLVENEAAREKRWVR